MLRTLPSSAAVKFFLPRPKTSVSLKIPAGKLAPSSTGHHHKHNNVLSQVKSVHKTSCYNKHSILITRSVKPPLLWNSCIKNSSTCTALLFIPLLQLYRRWPKTSLLQCNSNSYNTAFT